jgi:predicted HicB family RNase H-like nuclease
MITMKEWMELVDYKITEGGDYGWSCYGPNAYSLDSWNGVHGKGGYSFSIIFSTKTQKVYEVSVCDYTNNRAYRMIAENKLEKYRKEGKSRGINFNEAWDDVEYADLEVDDDFMQKCLAIVAGEDYDTSVMVNLDLPDDLLLKAALEAHKQNITLNDYINNALASLVEEFKKDPEGLKAQADLWKEENDIA